MALNFPKTRKEVYNGITTDFQTEIPESNPTLKNSWLRAFLMALAGAIFGIYERLKVLKTQLFAQTASDDDLLAIGNKWIGNYLAATISTGYVSFSGTVSSIIPAATLLQIDGLQYKTLSEVTIASNVQSITTIAYASNIATVTVASAHKLATGMSVVIFGASPAGINGTFIITVTGETIFTYTTTESGTGSATGTKTCTSAFVSVQIESLEVGLDKNQDPGAQMSVVTAISGVNTVYVQYSEIVGGTDIETAENYRIRLNFRLQNPVAHFNDADIILNILKLGIVNRIFVQDVTPALGQVTIYSLKENNVVPTATELTLIKNQILTIKPANTPDSAVYVLTPTLVPTNFTFTSITPDASTMRTAITNSLIAFFEDDPEIATDITETQYTNAIINTIDQTTGAALTDYTLSVPSAAITIATGEIGTLGTVSF